MIKDLYKKLKESKEMKKPARSAWGRGVQYYAEYLLDVATDWKNEKRAAELEAATNFSEFKKILLNGADDFKSFSWGGCALIYDQDIAKVLCNPSELKKTDGGRLRPNKSEDWLDVQARALYQGAVLLFHAIKE